jgi:hypothetical protein
MKREREGENEIEREGENYECNKRLKMSLHSVTRPK